MTTEDYLDKALKYATERYEDRHYEGEDTPGLSDWGEDYEEWVKLFRWTRYAYLDATSAASKPELLNVYLANPLHKMVTEAAKILVEEKGL